jgi:nitrite reductase/ring-hydroxylating ferredoxin subunit
LTTATTQVDVGAIDDFSDQLTFVQAGGRELVVFRWQGRVIAMRNRCPHQNLPFAGGRVRSRIAGGERVGDIEVHEEEPVLVCPVHLYEYDSEGRCTAAGAADHLRVKSYPVEVRGGRVLVDTGRG